MHLTELSLKAIHPPPPQKQGILPWVTSEENQRALSLSKYGIKVTDIKKQRVYQRHPLHWISNITYYEDTYGKHMVVLRQSNPERATGDPQDLFIYECVEEVKRNSLNVYFCKICNTSICQYT